MRYLTLIPVLFGLQALAENPQRIFPSLMVPLDERLGDKPLGTQKTADVEHAVHTEFSFDVAVNVASTCRLGFTMNADPARGAPWKLWGEAPYVFNVSTLTQRPIWKHWDTWNNRQNYGPYVASFSVDQAGNVNVTDGEVECAQGQATQYVLYPGSERDFGIMWFELKDPLHGLTYDLYE
ncbi:ubiquitin 3 binding protein But2 C-terminal domain-containing protein [Massariosphaeria phaeospora]|uniref:Ubiquitin 3 binding protein But2 C-terminal domain-containing protein n=1 Tax=Massariosphaeria phaeospora TaxID=100035 RepID=A0A7C8M5T6_9PLEO|nr:ubiquitin 3 binding protein But2 C-terminal domain-containing protein [Massariosphaeria phaeospora]